MQNNYGQKKIIVELGKDTEPFPESSLLWFMATTGGISRKGKIYRINLRHYAWKRI